MKKQTSNIDRLAQIDEARQRWQRRLTRATNALTKLERQRKRLLAAPKPVKQPVPKVSDVTDVSWAEMTGADLRQPEPVKEAPADDLSIPTFLKRPRAHAVITDLANTLGPAIREASEDKRKADAETAIADKRKAKARGRIAKMKAKQRGDLKAMPLTGKAALDAIRRGTR